MRAREKISRGIRNFFFENASSTPLAVFRILLSTCLLIQASFIAPHLFEMFGSQGILQDALARYLVDPMLPRISWFLPLANRLGLNESTTISFFGAAYLISVCFLLIGFKTRISAVLTWFFHWVLLNSQSASYGVDSFTHIGLFYLMLAPSGNALSTDAISRTQPPTAANARFFLRLLQIHLCIVYLASGLEKAAGSQWWDGEAIWRSLMLPLYAQYDMAWISKVPWFAKLLGWGTLFIEIGYPIFIWPRLTRRIWVAATISLHVGIILFLGLNFFGIVMSVFTLCAFGISAEPKAATAPLVDVPSTLRPVLSSV